MAISGGEVLVDDGDEVAGIVRAVVRGAAHDDLVVIEVLAIQLDAQLLAVVELECRLSRKSQQCRTAPAGRETTAKRDQIPARALLHSATPLVHEPPANRP